MCERIFAGGVYVSVLGCVYVSVLGGVYVSDLAQNACPSVYLPMDTDIHASCQHVAQNTRLSVCTLTDTDRYHSTNVRTHARMCVYSTSLHTFGRPLLRKLLAQDLVPQRQCPHSACPRSLAGDRTRASTHSHTHALAHLPPHPPTHQRTHVPIHPRARTHTHTIAPTRALSHADAYTRMSAHEASSAFAGALSPVLQTLHPVFKCRDARVTNAPRHSEGPDCLLDFMKTNHSLVFRI